MIIARRGDAGNTENQNQAEQGKPRTQQKDGLEIREGEMPIFPGDRKNPIAQKQRCDHSTAGGADHLISLAEGIVHGDVAGTGQGKVSGKQ